MRPAGPGRHNLRMSKGRDYSKYQHGVIRRFYEHRDTTLLHRLGELASDLALATDEAKAAALWKRVAETLPKAGANPARASKIVESRDVAALAALVGELSR